MTMTPEKTWEVFKVLVYGDVGALTVENRYVWYGVKNALKSGTSPWIVKGSSDSVTANMTGTDLWTDPTKIIAVTTTGVHSWIVFEAPELDPGANNVQILFDMVGHTACQVIQIYVSPAAGFTGGTNSTRPTATDEALHNSAQIIDAGSETTSKQMYVCKSTDGQCTRIFGGFNRTDGTVMMFDRIKNPHPAITRPYYTLVLGWSAQYTPTWAQVFGAANFKARLDLTSITTITALSATTFVFDTTSPLRESAYGSGESPDGNNAATPIGLFWPKTGALVDHMDVGMMFDFWLLGTYGTNWGYLSDSGGPWRMIRVGDGFAQPGDGVTDWWRVG